MLLLSVCLSVFATEMRVTQLFITNDGREYRHTFLYNNLGDILLEANYFQADNGKWIRRSQTEWFYTSNLTTQQQRVFENGTWRNTVRIETRYNFSGQKQEEITYDYISGVRTRIKRVVYENPGNVQSPIREYIYQNGVAQLSIAHSFTTYKRIYDDIVGVVIVMQQDIEVYDAGILEFALISLIAYDLTGIRRSHTLKRRVGDVYLNTDSTTWFYNEARQLVSQRSRTWNERGAYWGNTQRIDFEYDADGNLIAENYLQWSGMHWQNIYRYEYEYENGVQIRRTLQTYLHRDWRDLISIHYADFHNDRAREIWSEFNFWGGNAGEFAVSHIPFMFNDEIAIRRAERIRVSYDEISSDIGTDTHNPDLLISVFPNPSDGIFYLSTEMHEILSWKVFGFNGQLLKQHTQRFHTGVIDLTELPSGVYILQVETTVGTQHQRLIKR